MTPSEAIQARERALADPDFKAGYEAMRAWLGEPWPSTLPRNPHPVGEPGSEMWRLGAEQADLEEGSPDSWPDGGAGLLGVLRLQTSDN